MNTEIDKDAMKRNIMKSQAIRQAMIEFVGENRTEILKRAKAKLSAMGINVEESNLEQHINVNNTAESKELP